MNKNILYDSEPESEEEGEVRQEYNEPLPQNETIKPPKPPPKTPSKPKVIKHKIQEQWTDFVNDDIEKQQIKSKKEPEKLYKCEFCNKGFAKNYYLNRHIQEARCTIKRDIDLRRERELKELEAQITLKLQKQQERKARKEQKVKPVEYVEPVKPKQPRKPRAPPKPKQEYRQEEPVYIQPKPQRQIPKYIINF